MQLQRVADSRRTNFPTGFANQSFSQTTLRRAVARSRPRLYGRSACQSSSGLDVMHEPETEFLTVQEVAAVKLPSRGNAISIHSWTRMGRTAGTGISVLRAKRLSRRARCSGVDAVMNVFGARLLLAVFARGTVAVFAGDSFQLPAVLLASGGSARSGGETSFAADSQSNFYDCFCATYARDCALETWVADPSRTDSSSKKRWCSRESLRDSVFCSCRCSSVGRCANVLCS